MIAGEFYANEKHYAQSWRRETWRQSNYFTYFFVSEERNWRIRSRTYVKLQSSYQKPITTHWVRQHKLHDISQATILVTNVGGLAGCISGKSWICQQKYLLSIHCSTLLGFYNNDRESEFSKCTNRTHKRFRCGHHLLRGIIRLCWLTTLTV